MILSLPLQLLSQENNSKVKPKSNSKKESFVIRIDTTDGFSKDGFWMNGYVVDLGREEIEKLNGKKIKVKGELIVVKAVERTKVVDGKIIGAQGRYSDTKHLKNPKYRRVPWGFLWKRAYHISYDKNGMLKSYKGKK